MIDTNNIMFVHIKGMVRVEGGGVRILLLGSQNWKGDRVNT